MKFKVSVILGNTIYAIFLFLKTISYVYFSEMYKSDIRTFGDLTLSKVTNGQLEIQGVYCLCQTRLEEGRLTGRQTDKHANMGCSRILSRPARVKN